MMNSTSQCSSRKPGKAVGACRGKLQSPERRCRAVVVLQDQLRVPQRRAFRLVGQNRYTKRRPVPLADLLEQKRRRQIRELARSHVRWCRRLAYRRLWLEGWTVNHLKGGRPPAAPTAQEDARLTVRRFPNAAES